MPCCVELVRSDGIAVGSGRHMGGFAGGDEGRGDAATDDFSTLF